MSRSDLKKILVLGSTYSHTNLYSYYWHEIPEELNVADFDVVILDLSPFNDESYAKSLNRQLLPQRDQFFRLIFSENSEVVLLGHSRYPLGSPSAIHPDEWVPDPKPGIVLEVGEELRNESDEFSVYLQTVKKWQFHAEKMLHSAGTNYSYYARLVDPSAVNIHAKLVPLVETRFHRLVAYKIDYQLEGSTAKPQGSNVISTSG